MQLHLKKGKWNAFSSSNNHNKIRIISFLCLRKVCGGEKMNINSKGKFYVYRNFSLKEKEA